MVEEDVELSGGCVAGKWGFWQAVNRSAPAMAARKKTLEMVMKLSFL